MSALSAVGLHVAYGAREVLHHVDLELRGGEVLAIVGPNGAGKTTLMRALSGVVTPTAGEVRLDEKPLRSLSRREIARHISVVPQDVPRAPGFTVREVVAMGRAPHQDAWLRERHGDVLAVDAAMERCGLGALSTRAFDELSGGERKRMLVAQALSQGARVLLLDEPSAFLDLRHAVSIFELAREEAARAVAVAAIVHDLSLAARFADRVALLVDGAVLSVGPPGEVLEEGRLGDAFGVRIRRLYDQGTFAFAPDPTSR